ncbi:uncharacterized protein LOC5564821 [Aedes aegypti]|uniref:Uncharacterized protein n=1 Tax=Aedes aegypti TaxID=7159 RepID=A0A1S4EWD2_AEDAE|nr:uncharacterized protein LOC5564821 [Aedes aegypti]
MLQKIAVAITLLSLLTVAAGFESDYRKYLRTRAPRLHGEVHVEEVLEVFKSGDRPPRYGVYNQEVNAFLANDYLQKRRRTTTTTTTTTTKAPHVTNRPTYPVPNGDNKNPDYTELLRPTISMTKYPVPLAQTFIIQEARAALNQAKVEPTDQLASVAKKADAVDYQYSNEEDYLES